MAKASGPAQDKETMTSIHSSAIVDPSAILGSDVSIGPFSIIGPDVRLGDGVTIHNGVTIKGRTTLGDACEVFPGTVIGSEPQILDFKDFPESRTEIGARTILREQVTIHAGSDAHTGLTYIGEECYFMVGVHVAHDCHVANKCVFANQVTLGGNVHVEEQVWMGGLSAVVQHCRIGRHAFASGGAMIGGSVIPYGYVLGNRAKLVGLNVIGLKRRGFSRPSIHRLRAAYRSLFFGEEAFSERLSGVRNTFEDSEEVGHILDFISETTKPGLTLPEQ